MNPREGTLRPNFSIESGLYVDAEDLRDLRRA